jgi:cytochrome b561
MSETRTLVVERVIPHPPEKVWRALTQTALLEDWLMKNDFTPTLGAKFTFRTQPMPHWNGVVECEVLAGEPHRRLSYSWNAAAAPGAVGLRAAGRQQLQGRGLRLAAQSRGAGEGGRGARLTMKLASRYHPLLVTLHWLLAVLILVALAVGFLGLAAMDNTDPRKIAVLRWHMAGGMLILALMIVRFIVCLWTARPAPANRLAPVVHWGFYLLIVLMVGTGFATGLAAGLPEIVFAGSGAPLPQSFAAYPSFQAHFWLATLLLGFIVLHVGTALYHQLVRRDGLLRRMGFWRRCPARSQLKVGAPETYP